MRRRTPVLAAVIATAALTPTTAHAAVPHVVGPGETLWSIAAASNFTTRAVAVFNGLPETANVVLGSTIQIPSVPEAAAALQKAGVLPAPAGAQVVPAPAASAPQPAPQGAYVVRAGDSLSAIAQRSGVAMDRIAWMNGLKVDAPLLIGTVLKLPTGASTQPLNPQAPVPAQRVVPNAKPYPTPGRVTADQIAQVAIAHGVPAPLAAAIAWQESGFNNALVSSANARGVMQIMPGTWDYVEHEIAGHPLDPSQPIENVHAGVMYLEHLLAQTGGDQATTAAAYYQGLGSVRSRGMFVDTQRYVNSVMALRGRFGG